MRLGAVRPPAPRLRERFDDWLRDGELTQITHDHTLVQTLVDEGRISEEEASTHPQRSLITRALDGRGEVLGGLIGQANDIVSTIRDQQDALVGTVDRGRDPRQAGEADRP